MTYLAAMQEVAYLVGVGPPLKIDDTAPVAQRFRRMADRAGAEIARRSDWQGLIRSVQYTGDGGITQWDLPAGYDRQVGGNPVNIDGTGEFLRGAIFDDEWRFLKGLGSSSVKAYRIAGNKFETAAPLGSGVKVNFDYITSRWIVGSTTENFTTNDQTTVFPERLLILNVVWRWRRAQGAPYDDELKEFEADLAGSAQADRSFRPPVAA
jgi:hypothetical protein